jgi:23S rRNA (cytidine2498-2'-O)-methyltransferase
VAAVNVAEVPEGATRAAYLAPDGLEATLETELARAGRTVLAWHGKLALSPEPPMESMWALDVWTAPRDIPVVSIKSAASALRAMQRNWSHLPVDFHRRSALIAENLPPVKARPLVFPEKAPTAPLGAWTLLAPDRMLASPTKSSPFPGGAPHFVEDRVGPPSRAYLKLWEACTRIGAWPRPGETCLDLGASPGGWTWAIAKLGATVTAIDKAPLAPNVAAMPGVTLRQGSAFAMEPERVDWLFSDIIAYPARLLELVQAWIAAGAAERIVCTIKFQGETDFAAAEAFAAIPGAKVMHLFHNKHELTFCWAALVGGDGSSSARSVMAALRV